MNQKQLHMQPVSSRYLEQYNALLRYVFQVTDQELSSVGWQEKEFIRAKFPTMEKADVIGWFDRDTLVSQVAVYPMQARIFGRTYAMGGLTGVGTYPEYSNLGLMHKLLEQALTNMRARGQYLSYLYPYSIPYYRRKGWEVVSDKISYVIQDFQLPKARQVPGYVRRVKTDRPSTRPTPALPSTPTERCSGTSWPGMSTGSGTRTTSWRPSTTTSMTSPTDTSSTGSPTRSFISRT